MGDQYITAGELAFLVAAFAGPVLLGAGFAQFVLLRKAGCRMWAVLGLLAAAALITLVLAWGLLYVLPPVTTGGGVFLLPVVIAAATVTVGVGLYARRPRASA